jgi:sigma-B regulation protein RsbU (phosphoserine phosphatase)
MDLNYARDTTSGKEGLDLISSIQALDNILPIVVMTAWGTVDLAVEAMRRGGQDFVQKPWDNSRLLQTLRTQIERGRAKRRLQRKAAETQLLNLRLRQELEEAREIQQGLLPRKLPKFSGFELATDWQPAHTVSGDYLAAFKLDEQRAALCIADVCGKGLPAALLMSNMQAALKSASAETLTPRDLCARVNAVMCANTPENRFITCFYAVLDTNSRKLVFTNAGHNPPLLVRDEECIRLSQGGQVLGVFRDSQYVQSEVELRAGDRLVMFTDGLTEATDAGGEEFGEKRLLDLILKNRRRGASELQQSIMAAVKEFCGDEFHDDAALIVLAAS